MFPLRSTAQSFDQYALMVFRSKPDSNARCLSTVVKDQHNQVQKGTNNKPCKVVVKIVKIFDLILDD